MDNNRKGNDVSSWIKRGKEIIFPERYDEWLECVKVRSVDIYHRKEIEYSLEIMEALNSGASMEEAKEIFKNQEHSNITWAMTRNIVFSFSSLGPEFWENTELGKISPETRKILELKKQENMELKEAHTSGKILKKHM